MSIHVRAFTADDVALGMTLKTEAGWNQLEPDWRRAFALEPDGCFVGCWEGRAVGTVTTCVLGGDVAWIAMMLVSAEMRGKGVGRALMNAALDYLSQRGVRSVRLDATPLGRPLYESLGFVADFSLQRYAGRVANDFSSSPLPTDLALRPARPADLSAIAALDQRATATDRSKLLRRQFDDEAGYGWLIERGDELLAFHSKRSGANATQIGPCIATEASAGAALLGSALTRHFGEPLLVDIPDDNLPARSCVTRAGLTSQRPLARMTRGATIPESPTAIWASFGPEKG